MNNKEIKENYNNDVKNAKLINEKKIQPNKYIGNSIISEKDLSFKIENLAKVSF